MFADEDFEICITKDVEWFEAGIIERIGVLVEPSANGHSVRVGGPVEFYGIFRCL